ncbi:MAG: HDIG domain-containing protein [Anaerolineae bacterium]|nr:HDIG domain-containing protein [Anaerolineae bacterium]
MIQNRTGNQTGNDNQISGRHIWRGLLIALAFLSVSIFILVYQFAPAEDVIEDLDVGQVAPRDILAPQQFEYTSALRTEAERELRRKAISTIYTQPDPKVARQQVDRLRKIFDYLETIRADPYGSLAEKSEWIAAIPDLSLSDIVVDQILIMDENNWSETHQEALVVLNQAMRGEIRESQIAATRRQLPTLVPLDTPDEYANVIVDITDDLIKPNTFPDEARTETDRQAAAEAVEPVKIKVEKNESIISAGEIVTAREKEALEVLRGLQQPESSWFEDFIAPALLMLLITIIIGVYVLQYMPQILPDSKRLLVLALVLLIFVAMAKLMIPNAGLAYLYPIAALTMFIVTVIDVQLAFILTTVLAFLAGYLATDNIQAIVVYLILGGWTGALALGKSQRVNALLWACVYVGIVNTSVILIFNLSSIDFTTAGILLFLEGVLNGIFAAGLALVGLFFIGNVVGITTPVQLLDLGRPTHPLQRQLLLKAPGSYQHSLMVGNLAEQAAERIGADALLVRVMAYYHDIGKVQRPYFFIENQREGVNVHEKLEPQISAQIIISHVKDGLDLARKYRLPKVVKDGIAQHHGTSQVRYFYHQALKAAEEKHTHVDEASFRYPGPIPQTREIGILMLADVSETTVRALKPNSAEEIDHIVHRAIIDKFETGQLNDCDLTIADLHHIRRAFVDILQGVHHPRIKYPDQVKAEESATQTGKSDEQTKQESPGAETPETATPPVASTPATLHPLTTEVETRPMPLFRRE